MNDLGQIIIIILSMNLSFNIILLNGEAMLQWGFLEIAP